MVKFSKNICCFDIERHSFNRKRTKPLDFSKIIIADYLGKMVKKCPFRLKWIMDSTKYRYSGPPMQMMKVLLGYLEDFLERYAET